MKDQITITSRDPVIQHHTVHGHMLLPGLAYIDLIFQFLMEQGHDLEGVELSHLTIHRPLAAAQDRDLLLDIDFSAQKSGDWEFVLEGREQGPDSQASRRFLTTQIRKNPTPMKSESIDFSKILQGAGTLRSLEETYVECRRRGLVHQGLMKPEGIVFETEGFNYVEVSLPGEFQDSSGEFLFHPGLLDGCGVGSRSILPVEVQSGEPLILPFSFTSFRASEPIRQRCLARIKLAGSSRSGELVYLDIDFFNSAGMKVAELRGFANKLVRDPSLLDLNQPLRNGIGKPGSVTSSKTAPSKASARLPDPILPDVVHFLRDLIARKLNKTAGEIDPSAGYYEIGLDSIVILEITRSMEKKVGVSLPPTLLFEHTSIAELATHLSANYPEAFKSSNGTFHANGDAEKNGSHSNGKTDDLVSEAVTAADRKQELSEIAIIGMGGRYPSADNIEEFWNNLVAGRDCITEIPSNRWDWKQWEHLKSPSGKPISRWGGFIRDPDCFDAEFFRISPREAASLDPQERKFLEVCWEAMEDSGYTPETLAPAGDGVRRNQVGVFAGVMHHDYALLAAEAAQQGHRSTVSLNSSSIANRVSYTCNFHGPSIVFDTACSSSLTAIHFAVESLRNGSCGVALAGGVNLSLHPEKYLIYGLLDMHSSEGWCRAFGEGGDGYVSSEGIGAVLLKPLSRAIEDGDAIYAVIKASEINHVGKVSGLTVPSPVGQAEVISACLNKAGIAPRSIGCIEAHGTGTSLGDPIELEGLTRAFRSSTGDKNFCALSSVKSNIGHAEAAAGVAGVTKAALQLSHQYLVPSLHAGTENPHLAMQDSPFYLQKTGQAWKTSGKDPRRIGVSSFGASGANAHLVLEEFAGNPKTNNKSSKLTTPLLVALSAKNGDRLVEMASRLSEFLNRAASGEILLEDIAYTLRMGRKALAERAAFLVSSIEELKEALGSFVAGKAEDGLVFHGSRNTLQNGRLAEFVQGASMTAEVCRFATDCEGVKLAELWASGADPDWQELEKKPSSGVAQGRRIHLPTYPFARVRHWLPTASENKVRKTASDRVVPEVAAAASGLVYFSPVWKEVPLVANGVENRRNNDRLHLFVVSDSGRMIQSLIDLKCADLVIPIRAGTDAAGLVEHATQTIFQHCKKLIEEKSDGLKRIAVYFPESESEFPCRSLMGLLRSISIEAPSIKTKLIIDHGGTGGSLEARNLLQEIQRWDSATEVWYGPGGIRRVLVQNRVELQQPQVPVFRKGGVYWITGGWGGLGLLFARHLSSKFDALVVLTGRSAIDAAKEKELARLQESGRQIAYLAADISDANQAQGVLGQITGRFGELNGIIHCAGLIRDNYAVNKTPDEIAGVLKPKLRGAVVIDEATRDLHLDFVVFCSSIASFGGAGQLDYAVGNAFLDVFAAERNRRVAQGKRHGKTLSVNWPLWKEGGMNPGVYYEEQLKTRFGMNPLESSAGIETMSMALSSTHDQVGVVQGEIQKLLKFLKIDPKNSGSQRNGIHHSAVQKNGHSNGMVHELPLPASKTSKVLETVLAGMAKVFGLNPANIRMEQDLTDYGADSIMLTELANFLNLEFDLELAGAAFFELNNVTRIVSHIESVTRSGHQQAQTLPLQVQSVPAPSGSPSNSAKTLERKEESSGKDGFAIVGFDCFLPGSSVAEKFWEKLARNEVSTREVGRKEWKSRGVLLDDTDEAVHAMRWASLLEGISLFDPGFWDLTGEEADHMDPQQRLLLRSIWRAVEHAGYPLNRFTRSRVGLFVAADSIDYRSLLRNAAVSPGLSSGLSTGMLANRLSYFCNFKGPSESVDTACSSFYVAINRAIQSMQSGQCAVSVVAGVKILLDPDEFRLRGQGHLLSETGRVCSFDAKADGYVRGEGVGCLVLKPLRMAERDGDHIHAVITGIGISHNGKSGLSALAPDVEAQCQAMRDAYAMAGISPAQVNFIEANGAATNFSDAAEMAAHRKFFRESLGVEEYKSHRCAVGSVKANVGHLEGASGLPSLFKVLGAIEHGQIPPTPHFTAPHPSVFLKDSPFYIPTELTSWKPVTGRAGQQPEVLRAALHSIGIGGVNAHMIIEQGRSSAKLNPVSIDESADGFALVVLSARSMEALKYLCESWLAFLERNRGEASLYDLALESRLSRQSMECRLGLVVNSISRLMELLKRGVDPADDGLDSNSYRNLNAIRPMSRIPLKGSDPGRCRTLGELRVLADGWTGGGIDQWESAKTGPRIKIPQYPFQEKEFWFNKSEAKTEKKQHPIQDHEVVGRAYIP